MEELDSCDLEFSVWTGRDFEIIKRSIDYPNDHLKEYQISMICNRGIMDGNNFYPPHCIDSVRILNEVKHK